MFTILVWLHLGHCDALNALALQPLLEDAHLEVLDLAGPQASGCAPGERL